MYYLLCESYFGVCYGSDSLASKVYFAASGRFGVDVVPYGVQSMGAIGGADRNESCRFYGWGAVLL